MSINYQILIDEAMLGIVKKVLTNVQDKGLKDEQCFYISFNTNYPEVILSKNVKARYPKEITIVLQYQYRNLRVLNDRFSVNIAFNGINETIEVPFYALTGFSDPSVNFSLQFRGAVSKSVENKVFSKSSDLLKIALKDKQKKNETRNEIKKEAGEVVFIEKFRKKPK